MSSIEEKIGQLIITGFHGSSPEDAGVQKALGQIEAGELGGVALFRYNIESREQVTDLITAFKDTQSKHPPFIGLDQEGGKVQRVNSGNGFADTKSAKTIACEMSIAEARAHYDELGSMLSDTGFNFNWAPCVDLDDEPGCEVIGGIGRSYSDSPETVAEYARTMLESLQKNHIIGCLKHFPGHGRASGDTHEGLVDVTNTWSEVELEPYKLLLERSDVRAVMSAHLLHCNVDAKNPATLSKAWLSRLRNELRFNGVIISDCLHMGAIIKTHTLKEVVVKGLNAGLDILLFSNNPLAAESAGIRHASDSGEDYVTVADWQVPDRDLPAKIRQAVLEALDSGELKESVLDEAFKRVVTLKASLQE